MPKEPSEEQSALDGVRRPEKACDYPSEGWYTGFSELGNNFLCPVCSKIERTSHNFQEFLLRLGDRTPADSVCLYSPIVLGFQILSLADGEQDGTTKPDQRPCWIYQSKATGFAPV